MTRDEWRSLRVGDVIVETQSGVEREILSLSRVGGRTMISLRKLTPGYLYPNNPNTSYSNQDDRGRWRLKRIVRHVDDRDGLDSATARSISRSARRREG